jgi:hypothetical protein
MRRLLDAIRFIILSPEMVAALLPFTIYAYSPGLADILVKPIKEG